MNLERATLVVAVIALLTTGWCAWRIQGLEARLDRVSGNHTLRGQSGGGPPQQAAEIEQRLKKLEAASPKLGEIMSGIQLHLAKLYFASEARNWDLARFERGELEEGLTAAATLRPEENGVNLAGIFEAFKQTQLVSLKDAVEMKDRGLLREAYRDSILMCNTCHQSTGRPFISITIPTNPPVSNQRWDQAPGG